MSAVPGQCLSWEWHMGCIRAGQEKAREQAIRDCIAAVEAAICDGSDNTRANNRYDCCGCSSIDAMPEDAISALRALLDEPQ